MAALNRSDELHKFMTTYTGVHGQTAPDFSAATTLDGHQMDFYDSNVKKLIPTPKWMKKITSTGLWNDYTESREIQQKIYRNNIHVIMETLNHSDGVHTYQRMCGCVWNDKTGESQGFDHYIYDGEDFISLDLKENRYIASVELASPIVKKWNKEKTQLKYLKQYYELECVYWLKEFLQLSKAAEPEVSLLQKPPPNVPETIPKILTETSEDQIKPKVPPNPRPPGTSPQRSSSSARVTTTSLPETIPKILTEDHPEVSLLQKPPPKVPETSEDQNTPPSNASKIMDLTVKMIIVAVGAAALGVVLPVWLLEEKTTKSKTNP